jgi:hypothetical protein
MKRWAASLLAILMLASCAARHRADGSEMAAFPAGTGDTQISPTRLMRLLT